MSGRQTRLAVVNPYQHGGGAEFQIACLTEQLASGGDYDITYLTRYVEPALRPQSYRVLPVAADRPLSRFGYVMDARPLLRALATANPDVIYQRVACGYTGICAYYARRRGVRMVWHVAHDSDVMPTAHTAGRNPVRRRLEKWAIEYGLRRTHAIIVQTEQQAALLERNYGRRPDAIIPNFHPAPAEAIDKSGPLTVLWVANIKPMKQPEAFVRLARALADLPDVQFVMVGAYQTGGSDAEWGREVMADISATPNLRFLGHQSQGEVNALLARAQVFVNTSLQEGFPNTFIQAWLRKAVVCSLHVDPDGLLAREQLGIPAQSEAGLAAAVRRLLGSEELRNEYAARGLAGALARHSLQNVERVAAVLEARN